MSQHPKDLPSLVDSVIAGRRMRHSWSTLMCLKEPPGGVPKRPSPSPGGSAFFAPSRDCAAPLRCEQAHALSLATGHLAWHRADRPSPSRWCNHSSLLGVLAVSAFGLSRKGEGQTRRWPHVLISGSQGLFGSPMGTVRGKHAMNTSPTARRNV